MVYDFCVAIDGSFSFVVYSFPTRHYGRALWDHGGIDHPLHG